MSLGVYRKRCGCWVTYIIEVKKVFTVNRCEKCKAEEDVKVK